MHAHPHAESAGDTASRKRDPIGLGGEPREGRGGYLSIVERVKKEPYPCAAKGTLAMAAR